MSLRQYAQSRTAKPKLTQIPLAPAADAHIERPRIQRRILNLQDHSDTTLIQDDYPIDIRESRALAQIPLTYLLTCPLLAPTEPVSYSRARRTVPSFGIDDESPTDRNSYNTRSNKVRVIKTPGGKLQYQHLKKRGSPPKCGDCGIKLPGVCLRSFMSAPAQATSLLRSTNLWTPY